VAHADELVAVVTTLHHEEGTVSLTLQLVAVTVRLPVEETSEVLIMDVVGQKDWESTQTEVDAVHQYTKVDRGQEFLACSCFHPSIHACC